MDKMLYKLLFVGLGALVGIVLCMLLARILDIKNRKTKETKRPLVEEHPNINMMIGLMLEQHRHDLHAEIHQEKQQQIHGYGRCLGRQRKCKEYACHI